MKKSKIIGLIPARINSSRFPGKPFANICGYPMIYWVYNQVKKVRDIDEIYVVTEDVEVQEVCEKYNIPVWLGKRKATTGAEALSFASQQIEGDIFINIQGDEPLIEPLAIKQVIDAMVNNKELYYVGLRSKIKTENEFLNRNVVKVVTDNEGFALYFSRSPIPYTYNPEECYRVMGLYGYSSDFLRMFSSFPKSKLENGECGVEMLRVMERGYKIKLLETEYNTIGVDLPEHIQQVEKIIREQNCN